MAYQLSAVTLRTRNSSEGLAAIGALWEDIQKGRLPLLFDSEGAPPRALPHLPVQQL